MTKRNLESYRLIFCIRFFFNDKYSLIFIYYLDDILCLYYFNCEFYILYDIFSLSLFELALFGVLFNCNLRKYKI